MNGTRAGEGGTLPRSGGGETHYGLLGLEPFEGDGAKIRAAALARSLDLKRLALDPDKERALRVQEMLNRVGMARAVLEDPVAKARYDAALRAGGRPDELLAAVPAGEQTCPVCGGRMAPGVTFCDQCGIFVGDAKRVDAKFGIGEAASAARSAGSTLGPAVPVHGKHRRNKLLTIAVVMSIMAIGGATALFIAGGRLGGGPRYGVRTGQYNNSLGMRFTPVPGTGVLFSVWETRVSDYEAFVRETARKWERPRFVQGGDHPAAGVSWEDARAFCRWLTEKERVTGRIGANEVYRLPLDQEWSTAVGIGDAEDPSASPEAKDRKIPDVFPWGTAWPPPWGVANLDDETTHDQVVVGGFTDGFWRTSPVGRFRPDRHGLRDLGGNVSEWCEDGASSSEDDRKVLRGPSWASGKLDDLLSSRRRFGAPGASNDDVGFRCVLAARAGEGDDTVESSAHAARKSAEALPGTGGVLVATGRTPGDVVSATNAPIPGPEPMAVQTETSPKVIPGNVVSATNAPASGPEPMAAHPEPLPVGTAGNSIATASAARPYENGLGMKFVPVPGSGVLFSIWETRVKDFEAFVAATGEHWTKPDFEHGPDHPAVNMDWDDAVAFCRWLTEEERAGGHLPEEYEYRMPRFAEWDIAVGPGIYPWGDDWPPPQTAGNYAGEESAASIKIEGYNDGFSNTAPVGAFSPNLYGLYDMGGNAAEWCENFSRGETVETPVARGASYRKSHRANQTVLPSNLGSNPVGGRPPATIPSSYTQDGGFVRSTVYSAGGPSGSGRQLRPSLELGFRCVLARLDGPTRVPIVIGEAPHPPEGQANGSGLPAWKSVSDAMSFIDRLLHAGNDAVATCRTNLVLDAPRGILVRRIEEEGVTPRVLTVALGSIAPKGASVLKSSQGNGWIMLAGAKRAGARAIGLRFETESEARQAADVVEFLASCYRGIAPPPMETPPMAEPAHPVAAVVTEATPQPTAALQKWQISLRPETLEYLAPFFRESRFWPKQVTITRAMDLTIKTRDLRAQVDPVRLVSGQECDLKGVAGDQVIVVTKFSYREVSKTSTLVKDGESDERVPIDSTDLARRILDAMTYPPHVTVVETIRMPLMYRGRRVGETGVSKGTRLVAKGPVDDYGQILIEYNGETKMIEAAKTDYATRMQELQRHREGGEGGALKSGN